MTACPFTHLSEDDLRVYRIKSSEAELAFSLVLMSFLFSYIFVFLYSFSL